LRINPGIFSNFPVESLKTALAFSWVKSFGRPNSQMTAIIVTPRLVDAIFLEEAVPGLSADRMG
jgi:hypothetical protein